MPQLLVWAILFMGLFRTLISPPPIAPQIFTLYQRERFNRNSGEIHIAIQSFWMKQLRKIWSVVLPQNMVRFAVIDLG